MKKTLAALSMLLLAFPAWSAQRDHVVESVLLNAPAAQAWNLIKDFGAINRWHPAVTKTDIIAGQPPLRGAIRKVTVGDNQGSIEETLTDYSDADMKMSYVINATNIVPVKDYASTLNVVPISDKLSLVIWSGSFLPNPPKGKTDADARKAVVGIYRAGLDNLPKLLKAEASKPADSNDNKQADKKAS